MSSLFVVDDSDEAEDWGDGRIVFLRSVSELNTTRDNHVQENPQDPVTSEPVPVSEDKKENISIPFCLGCFS